MEQSRRLVLVVDDDPAALLALGALLEAKGLAVALAASADGAIECLGDEPLPDAILTDLDMPGRSGDELLAVVRANPRWRSVPVVAMSGCSRLLQEKGGGADAKLGKPIDPVALMDALAAARAVRARR